MMMNSSQLFVKMYRWLVRVVILIVAFAAGFAVGTFRTRRAMQPTKVTFSADGETSAFRSHYHSSDGQFLSYGCYEHESSSVAETSLHSEIRPNYKYVGSTPVQLVERTVTLDAAGNKTGERALLDNGDIYWTEGPRFHLIFAPSVKYALLFEKSRAWAWEGCMKLPPRDKASG